MPLSNSDLVFYGSANMPEADGATAGGSIQTNTRVIFDDATLGNTLNDTVEVLSSNAGDTSQTVTVTGRNSSGSIISENFNLNGTTVQNGATTFERILKVVVSASHTGTVTVRKASDNTTIIAIETGVLTVRRPFYNVSADVGGGSTRNFYEKVFLRNNSSTNALLNAAIVEGADALGKLTFALANAKGDSESVANRQTAPSSVTAFNGSSKNVPGTDLGTSENIGVWLNLTLAAGDAAAKSTYRLDVSGQST